MRKATTHIDLFIPEKFSGMNEFITANRAAPQVGNSLKHKNQDVIKAYLLQYMSKHHIRRIEPPVYISYTFQEKNRRRDLDNISGFFHKVFQDALVEVGLLQDDGWKDIQGFRDNFKVGNSYGVHVVIMTDVKNIKRK